MKQGVFIALLLCLGQAHLAMAGGAEGLYVKMGIGYVSGQDQDGEIGDLAEPADEVEFDFGQSVSYQAGLGYAFNESVTIELSGQYVADFELEGPYVDNGISLDGRVEGEVDLQTSALLMNLQLDMASFLDQDWALRPYLGIGVGYARNKLGDFTYTAEVAGYSSGYIEGNTENDLAWRAAAGVTYPLTESFVLDMAYSYTDFGEAESEKEANGGALVLLSPLSVDVKAEEVSLALRYFF